MPDVTRQSAARLAVAVAIALAIGALTVAGCAQIIGEGPDVEAARSFNGYPLYWVGERFED